jgi:ABC-type multidrug transport system permease subunit
MTRISIQKSARIILAIALKDITEALKNRTLLTATIGVLLLMLTGPALSLLINRDQPMLVMNESADPGIVQSLEERDDLQLVLVSSQEQMEAAILQPPQTIIGVVVPSVMALNSDAELVLEGYCAHWVSESRLQEHLTFFEGALSEASGETVRINITGNRIYPSLEVGNQFSMIAISLTTMILLMGLALVPYLFIEEKESHTLEALLISPARFWELVIGKLLAGAVYCIVAGAIVLLLNFRIVVHWELMLTTVVLGTIFAVAVGLLMGLLFDNAASMGLWTGILTIVLLVSPLLQTMGVGKLPAVLQDVLSWLPSTVVYNLAVLSMLGEVPIDPVWQGIILLIASSIVIYLLVIWRIRRMDR